MKIFGTRGEETMIALARRTGIGETQLSNYRTGKVIPTLPVARRLAAAVETPLDDLLFAGEATPDKRSKKSPTV